MPALALVIMALIAALTACSRPGSPSRLVPPSPSSTPVATATPTPAMASSPIPTPFLKHAPTTGRSASPPRPAAPASQPPTAATTTRYVFPVQGCTVSYGHSHHDYPATDIFAAQGCLLVAPVTGHIDEVSSVDRWNSRSNNGADRGGLSISIVGADGVRYYGSHLSAVFAGIGPGVPVNPGDPIGRVGSSGDARGGPTHLHFGISWPTALGIWWVRRGEIYPWPYLDAWRAGHDVSPAPVVAAERARVGTMPPCRIDC